MSTVTHAQTPAAQLSAEDIAHYQRDGYVIPRYRLEPELLKGLQDALNTLIANNPGVRPENWSARTLKGAMMKVCMAAKSF